LFNFIKKKRQLCLKESLLTLLIKQREKSALIDIQDLKPYFGYTKLCCISLDLQIN